MLNEIDGLEMRSSTFEKAAYGNKQLMHPSEKGKRQEILEQYRIGGWDNCLVKNGARRFD